MSKSGKIREYIREHPGAQRADIAVGTKIDANYVTTICTQRVKAGEFEIDKSGGVSLNAEFKRFGHGERKKRLPKKLRGFKAARRAREARGTRKGGGAAKRATPAAVAPSPVQLHVRTTFAVLDAVINLDGAEPVLVAAFQAHREALELAGA